MNDFGPTSMNSATRNSHPRDTTPPTHERAIPMAMALVTALNTTVSSLSRATFGATIRFRWSMSATKPREPLPMQRTYRWRTSMMPPTPQITIRTATVCPTDGKLNIDAGWVTPSPAETTGVLTRCEQRTPLGMQTVMACQTCVNTSGLWFV